VVERDDTVDAVDGDENIGVTDRGEDAAVVA